MDNSAEARRPRRVQEGWQGTEARSLARYDTDTEGRARSDRGTDGRVGEGR